MATRRPGKRAFRPSTESLETRKLLARVITGIDLDGDTWELRLVGPGDLSVINQPDATDAPVPLGEPALIASIAVGGADPMQSQLVGRVTPGLYPRGITGEGAVGASPDRCCRAVVSLMRSSYAAAATERARRRVSKRSTDGRQRRHPEAQVRPCR